MIRRAEAGDAEAMDALHVRAWQRAFSDFLSPEHLLETPAADRVARWRARMDLRGVRTWVWDQDGHVAGFAAAGEADDEDAPAGSLWALYVDPPAQGAGVGDALLAHAEREMTAGGHAEAVLWVFTEGAQARRFYEARGWVLEAGSERRWQTDPVPSVRYRKRL